MDYPLKVLHSKVKTQEQRDTVESARQNILGKVTSIGFFEDFNPRSYDTYWYRLQYPVDYLEQVGIEKIAELVHHGFSPSEIAKMLCISSLVLRRWTESRAEYEDEIERSKRYIGNERAYQALRVVEKSSTNPEELAKAKALSGVYMAHAQAQDKPTWGKHQTVDQKISATMSYSIDLSAAPAISQHTTKDVTPKKVSKVDDTVILSELMMELSVPEGIEI